MRSCIRLPKLKVFARTHTQNNIKLLFGRYRRACRNRPALYQNRRIHPEGAELLREAALSARLPILAKTADIAALSEEAKAVFAAECRAGDIYALCLTNAAECGAEKRFRPIIIK